MSERGGPQIEEGLLNSNELNEKETRSRRNFLEKGEKRRDHTPKIESRGQDRDPRRCEKLRAPDSIPRSRASVFRDQQKRTR